MESLFLVTLLALAVLVVVVVAAAVRGAVLRRRGETEAPAEPTPSQARDPHEFFKSVGEQMKMRVYSLDEYGRELGGDASAARNRGFLAALKAYRAVEDDWYAYPPDMAAEALELSPASTTWTGRAGRFYSKSRRPACPGPPGTLSRPDLPGVFAVGPRKEHAGQQRGSHQPEQKPRVLENRPYRTLDAYRNTLPILHKVPFLDDRLVQRQ